ncbi:MAG: hypothetical protein KatS3mg108_2016 [Isosphaeraceae bacterium]|jgi:transcriptional regulator with XRE-family HTH domain|nr:MAG: hypothetical protein KatS3mg108_2016 [Isosphaeraceae bacterium]
MTLARKVRQLRYAKGWGPDDLAARANISRTALYQIECGKTSTPRAATLRRIARALGVGLEQLLSDAHSHHDETPTVDKPAAHEPDPIANGKTHGWPDALETNPRLRDLDLERKFQILLNSPLRESIARIVDESYRLVVRDQRHDPV